MILIETLEFPDGQDGQAWEEHYIISREKHDVIQKSNFECKIN